MGSILKRPRHIPWTSKPTALKGILDSPHTIFFLLRVQTLPSLPQRTVQTAWRRNVRSSERGENGLVDQEERHHDLEDPGCL